MNENVLIAVAWPYANAEIHVGNLTGSYLPADIAARYHRLRGRRVLMVSGSDAHGTPITVRADAEKLSSEQVYQRYHAGFIDLFQQLGLTYDLFTSTHTDNHFKVSQAIFLSLHENGYIYPSVEKQWFAPSQGRFLPDRYVEGTCYICGFVGARSDQCDKCGSLLDPTLLIDPRSKIDGSTPELRDTEHSYLDLGKLQETVVDFLRQRESYWRPNVLRQSLGQILANGLRGRPITRDLDWGIPVPLEGWEGKCLYVWFEAVIGYLSAAIEWANISGQPDAWRDWWQNEESKTFYFIGKDNIPFHAVIWPAQLSGTGTVFDKYFAGTNTGKALVLPYDVPANEFMNLEGDKISGSRNWAVWGRDFLTRYDPDPLRYYLTVNMPETRDSEWDWQDFLNRNNDELVATWGNLANRVLAFNHKQFEGRVPEPGELTAVDEEILRVVEKGFETVAAEMEATRLRSALNLAMGLATEVNRYLDHAAPWKEIKTDRAAAARTVYTALCCIDSLSIMLAPFIPHTSEKLHAFFGYEQTLFGVQYTETIQDSLGEHKVLRYKPAQAPAGGESRWQPSRLKPGQPLQTPTPLFKKLEPTIVAEERARLGKTPA
jgi:methionyl-tRNA synthetase